jgi:hypothetical protein
VLCLKLKECVFDLRWPGGLHLALHGPTSADWAIFVKVVGSAEPAQRYRVPATDQRIVVRIAGVQFAMIGRPRSGASVALDLPPECEVVRRPRGGRRRAC